MDIQQHPITPPPELVQQWRESAPTARDAGATREAWIAAQAARWGADQELEACLQLVGINGCPNEWLDMLCNVRRPMPPSLAEQALEALGPVPLPETGGTDDCFLNAGAINRYHTIRAALERLQELENGNE